jgi:predicted RNase H-like nuclease (RuvC/YqgF family)
MTEQEILDLQAKVSKLETENASLVKENEDLKAGNELLEEDNANLKSEVERLMKTDDKDEKKNGVGETFTVEVVEDGETVKKKFVILCAQIRIPGIGKCTALEILTNEKAQAALVKSKSGMIKEVV